VPATVRSSQMSIDGKNFRIRLEELLGGNFLESVAELTSEEAEANAIAGQEHQGFMR
jgi:hypothetical protein